MGLDNKLCMRSGSAVATGLAESLDKPHLWAAVFFFGNTELSMKLWNVFAGVSELGD